MRASRHAERVEIERDELEAAPLEHAGEVLPDAAEAADHHVFALRNFPRRRGLEREIRRLGRWPAQDPVGDAPVVAHEQRAEQHAQRDGRQQRLHDAVIDGVTAQQQRQQGKPELTAHAHCDGGAQRLAIVGHEPPHDQRDDHRLDEQQHRDQQQHQRQLREQQAQVQQHADGDEEQAEQDVLERLDDGLGLVLELGLGEQHAGEKPAERHRQPHPVRGPGGEQRHEQDRQRENLGAAVMRDLAEERTQQPASHDEHDDEGDQAAPRHAEQPQWSRGLRRSR